MDQSKPKAPFLLRERLKVLHNGLFGRAINSNRIIRRDNERANSLESCGSWPYREAETALSLARGMLLLRGTIAVLL